MSSFWTVLDISLSYIDPITLGNVSMVNRHFKNGVKSEFGNRLKRLQTDDKLVLLNLSLTGSCIRCRQGTKAPINTLLFKSVCPFCLDDLTNIHSGMICFRNVSQYFNLEVNDVCGLPYASRFRELNDFAQFRTGDIIIAAAAKYGSIQKAISLMRNKRPDIATLCREFNKPLEPLRITNGQTRFPEC